MKKTDLQKNSVYIFLVLVWDFFVSIASSAKLFVRSLLGKKAENLPENSFLDSLNFILQIGPRSFWRRPSGIKIGRSLSTLLHYVFAREKAFRELSRKR